jgi:hypothetical protein
MNRILFAEKRVFVPIWGDVVLAFRAQGRLMPGQSLSLKADSGTFSSRYSPDGRNVGIFQYVKERVR